MLGNTMVDTHEVVLPAPPPMPDDDASGGPWTTAVPMLGGLGSVAMMTGVGGASQGARGWVVGGLLLLSTCAMVAVQVVRQRTQRVRRLHDQRRSYLHLVAEARPRVRAAAGRQRASALQAGPGIDELLVDGPRSLPYEALRVGVGSTRLAVRIAVTDPPSGVVVDPVCAQAAQRFVAAHATLDELPVALPAGARLVLDGDRADCLSVARAVVAQATAAHDPATLAVGVLTSRRHRVDWDWVKWVPHVGAPPDVADGADALGARRMVDEDPLALARLLEADARDRLLVVDAATVPAWADDPRTTVVALRDPSGRAAGVPPGTAVLDVPAGVLRVDGKARSCRPDRCDVSTAEVLARRTASAASVARQGAAPARDFLRLVGTTSPDVLPVRRSACERLVAPLGHARDGTPVVLDLKEAAEGGSGPHGLVVGATGSGKSELLRTLVLGLVATHGPDELAMVLVDFKGGATFAELEHLPHVAGFVTNLADDLAMVERMQDALGGELVRRQELLRATGHASLAEHRAAREAGARLDPIPSLFVCVDEFSELLSARPELVDLFVAFGRLGRSLGIHLLLATQRLEEGRLRGLESHLSYRVALRTFSASESRTAIGVPDAHTLPPGPGAGLLRTGPEELVRFDTAYVSGPWRPRRTGAAPAATVLPFTVSPVEAPVSTAASELHPDGEAESTSLLARVVAAADRGAPTHRIWQPPLTEPVVLGDLVGDLLTDPRLGLHSAVLRSGAGLEVTVGVVDRPHLQRRDPLVLDLRGAGGHVAVVGGPRSGRSTALQTYVTSLALGSTPQAAQVHLLDLAGGALGNLAALPHVVGHARRGEDDLVRRVVDEVCDLVDRRERQLRDLGVGSVEQLRDLVRTGADAGPADVHLVVDGWGLLRTEHEDCEARLVRLASRALTFGVHLVVATHRWSDLRPSLRDLVGTRVELRLTDAYDSEVDRRAASHVPADQPGRGLVHGPEHVRLALPRVDEQERVEDLVDRIARSWTGPRPRRLEPLPDLVPLTSLRTPDTGPGLLPLALEERSWSPLLLNPVRTPHLLVRGAEGSGRTQTLRTYVTSLLAARSPDTAQVLLLDPRRRLAGAVPDPHLLAHVTDPEEAGPVLRELVTLLGRRTADHERDGAEVHVVVDDADLVVDAHGSPALDVLVPLLPRAGDLGLRLVVARRLRGQHAPVDRLDRALDDLGAGVLTLTGPVPGRATWRVGTGGKEVTVQVAHT